VGAIIRIGRAPPNGDSTSSEGVKAMYDESKHVPVVGTTSVASEYGSITTVGWLSAYTGLFEEVPAGKTRPAVLRLLNSQGRGA
jgi:hypothetical protein